jgi:tripartite-type tricarboxylate transporter receptor subunit TctC
MPEVPTIAEAGVPGYEATIWLGLMAPKGTPAPIVARLNAEVAKIVGNPETAKAWKAQGATPMMMSTAEFARYLNDDIVKWAHIVKVSGAKPEQ